MSDDMIGIGITTILAGTDTGADIGTVIMTDIVTMTVGEIMTGEGTDTGIGIAGGAMTIMIGADGDIGTVGADSKNL